MKLMNKKIINDGFTLIELIVVMSIITILMSISISAYFIGLRRSRDSRRIADINTLINTIQTYNVEMGEYPGESDDTGEHISQNCASDLRDDLIANRLIESFPSDPFSASIGCNLSLVTNIDQQYFYGWDSDRALMSECISINRLETVWGLNQLIAKFGQAKSVTTLGDANIGSTSPMQFNYCFVMN
ncbi:hypothetical protein COY14_04290 [Candidatus Roizmanbacteria bacterium CG_4_10_14_0_2_um_filter_36_9]|uniref:Type II secretion system protein GspG C-terminal domain-containing protein n=1 Tax=Candidatus Roizmanbacteria bacterium CG_4_10_14_0_2_um_filter_36_9 TaxID=1974823 RepID=A0A2M7U2Q5_9BACT|nr:MAG: hypothetical protein COY14_04290 [Candidatus Roizmanbacteria bacterium CG_4_10_14_0_2_um_filter_36_9]